MDSIGQNIIQLLHARNKVISSPFFRDWSDIRKRSYMEDAHICIPNLAEKFGDQLPGKEILSGDCSAILSRHGLTFEMSRDHKPFSHNERMLVESLGGFIRDGYLNGELGVTRALVDFVKRRLQDHNDVKRCCKETVEEAIKRGAGDNLAVVIVCFQSHPPPRMVVQRGREEFKGSLPILLELRKYKKYTEGLG
ncbi:phosphatase 2C 54 [Tanacetum coccineum]